MAICKQCGKSSGFFDVSGGRCFECRTTLEKDSTASRERLLQAIRPGPDPVLVEKRDLDSALALIVLTTESAHDLPIIERLEIITAECVLGMNIFNDIGSALRDLVGGRNETYQAKLREARKTVLNELKREAHQLGANAVVGVDLDYSEISGGGKSMLFLVASGTAVRLAETNS